MLELRLEGTQRATLPPLTFSSVLLAEPYLASAGLEPQTLRYQSRPSTCGTLRALQPELKHLAPDLHTLQL